MTSRDPLETAVLSANIRHGARLLVAVSGGADSVALFDVLDRLAPHSECHWILLIGHVNHGLRGAESDADQHFIETLAHDRGIEIRTARVEPGALSGPSLEGSARQERYRLLHAMLTDWKGDAIVTAHTRDDQAETLLLHLLRGAGPAGIGAIRPHRDGLLRPFLTVSREEVISYCQRRQLPYRLDSSNLDLRHTRNRIRHRVMPVLREVTPDPAGMLARSAAITAADAEYIAAEAATASRLLNIAASAGEVSADLHTWTALHTALRHTLLRELVATLVGSLADLTLGHVETMEHFFHESRTRSSLSHQLPHGLTLAVETGRMVLRRGPRPVEPPLEDTALPVPGEIGLPPGRVTATLLADADRADLDRLLTVCGPNHAFCDATTLDAALTIRSRRPGDRIRPMGRGGSRKLQDLLVDAKVPAGERDRVPVVACAGRIVWVAGHALDEYFAATVNATAIVHLTFTPSTQTHLSNPE